MLERILRHIHNWFDRDPVRGFVNVVRSTFTIEDGELHIAEGFLQEGQFYRIQGSTFNDGLHIVGDTDLRDETFYGAVYGLKLPNDFIALANEIEQWQSDYEEYCEDILNAEAPYKSESFGGYTYTKADVPSKQEQATMWTKAFASQLAKWAKVPL